MSILFFSEDYDFFNKSSQKFDKTYKICYNTGTQHKRGHSYQAISREREIIRNETTGGKNQNLSLNRENTVPRLRINKPILSQLEEWVFAFFSREIPQDQHRHPQDPGLGKI